MNPSPSRTPVLINLLHLWRVVLLCATITHERHHPALAILLLVPVNHIFFRLTASLAEPATTRSRRPGPMAVVGLYLLATIGIIWWYGALRADVRALSRTWEWWMLVGGVTVLTVLYRPLIAALKHLVGATGLGDSRLWTALGLALAIWIWCNGIFAALYQRLALICEGSGMPACEGKPAFSQPLSRFADAVYFSTITLSTTGFGDIVPVSAIARILVAVEIMVGFGLVGFLLSRVAGLALPASRLSDRDPP